MNNENNKNNDHIENENNNDEFNKDFLNNVSEELQAKMRMLQSYNNIGEMVGSYYMGLVDIVGEELAKVLTETFIYSYVHNLFNSFGGERK